MRKLFIVGIAIIGLFASCKKADRVCECTYADGTKESITYLDETSKKSAKENCENYNNIKYDYDGEVYEEKGTKCELK
jgi:hypothetical protein